MRLAEPEDIVQGHTVYILGDDEEYHKMLIEEVLRPSDDFKAFCADDGCRYGLSSTYIYEADPEHPLASIMEEGHTFTMAFKVTDTDKAVQTCMEFMRNADKLAGISSTRIDFTDTNAQYKEKLRQMSEVFNVILNDGEVYLDADRNTIHVHE